MVFFRVVVVVFLSFWLLTFLELSVVHLLHQYYVLPEMMWLLCLTLFVPDTTFAYHFLNPVSSLIACSLSSLVVSGLYFTLLNCLNLRSRRRRFVFVSLALMVFSI